MPARVRQDSEMKLNDADRIRAALAQSAHVRDLPPPDLEALARIGRLTRMHAGEACAGGLFLVLEGRLRIYSLTAQGQEFIYAFLGRGELFGFAEILQRAPSPIEARAAQATTLAVFPLSALRPLLDARPNLWRHFAGLTYDRLIQTLLLARDISLAPLPQRLARRLLWQALNAGNGAHGSRAIEVHVSQTDLARMLGSGRSRVNEALKQLERSGMVSVGYRSVQLIDMGALRRIAGPDLPAG
jgi:CRP-like cAMP-binding protein